MKLVISFLTINLLSLSLLNGQTNSLTIIGTNHFPSKQFNSDTLLNLLNKLKPDIVLLELDSSLFSKTFDEKFKLKYQSKENEPVAVTKYIELHPGVIASHFDYENRDNYRRQRGIRKAEPIIAKLLDSLYKNNHLSKHQTKIIKKYYQLTENLNSFVEKPILEFNTSKTDKLAKKRQFYQHHKIRQVISQRKEFTNQFVATSLGNKVSLKKAYDELSLFWDLRNQTMAENIIKVVLQNPKKKIVVLTGFFHRYYLKSEINKQDKAIKLSEYYDN